MNADLQHAEEKARLLCIHCDIPSTEPFLGPSGCLVLGSSLPPPVVTHGWAENRNCLWSWNMPAYEACQYSYQLDNDPEILGRLVFQLYPVSRGYNPIAESLLIPTLEAGTTRECARGRFGRTKKNLITVPKRNKSLS